MLTLADVDPTWVGLYRVLAQRDFEPSRLVLESAAHGFTRDFLRKRVFIDIIVESRLLAWRRPDKRVSGYFAAAGFWTSAVTYPEWYANLKAFVEDTPYFDKWLKAYRLTDGDAFAGFCSYALSTWSKGSCLRYELAYALPSPSLPPLPMQQAAEEVAHGIIEKTRKLLGKDGI